MTNQTIMTLGQCCTIISGATPVTSVNDYWNGDICWTTPKDLSNLTSHYLGDTPRKITKLGLESCGASILPRGSVLFSSRAPIGHVAINAVPMATNQGFKSFIPNPEIVDAKFLFHWLRKNRAYLESLGNGATFKEVSKATVSRIEIALPSVEVQRRSAAILDQADALRAKRRKALTLLDSLTQAIFIEMFGTQNSHPVSSLAEMCVLITDGTHQTPTYADDGVIFLSAKNVTSGYVDWKNIKYIPKSLHRELHSRLSPKINDILLAKNGTTGVAAIVDRECIFDIYVSLALLRAKKDVLPAYLLGAINSPICKKQFNESLKGIGVPNLHLKEIRATQIPHPPLSLQKEFLHRTSAIEKLKASHRSSLAEFEALFSSLQHRAFRGEL